MSICHCEERRDVSRSEAAISPQQQTGRERSYRHSNPLEIAASLDFVSFLAMTGMLLREQPSQTA